MSRASILWDKHFLLAADIDIDPNLPNRPVFTQAPIHLFTGVFDGNGHVISNLAIEGGTALGLFGKLASGAEVKHLGVVDVNVFGSGLSGAGGLAGENYGTVTHCYSAGVVSGGWYDGGIVGSNAGKVSGCYSTCVVSGSGWAVGGLVGSNRLDGSITTSYCTGAVSGWEQVGGLIGSNYRGLVSQCYSTGLVDGYDAIGGLVGLNTDWEGREGIVTQCFWDIQTSGQTASAGGEGKTTAEMQMVGTFIDAGWDFVGETANGTEDIWWILEGQDYPRLWWESE